jgi:two-component system nitrogen regulation sensor histidine kinase NtrY
VRLCEEILLLFGNAHSDITFTLHSEQEKMWLDMDAGLMRQALTNLVKNAVEAIQDNPKVDTEKNITITLAEDDNYGIITVADSGRGLDGQDISKLTEPYVTTREKGTGLGLAIVKKIMDEHHASLSIQPNSPVGAKIIIKIRKKPLDQPPTNE